MQIQENIPLAQFTTFRIGGPARFFVAVSQKEDLSAALSWVKEKGLSVLILGGGSNLLIDDKGFPGLVIKMSLGGWSFHGQQILVGAGVWMLALARETSRRGLRGLEWAGGLPGTLGGAIRGNAGSFRFEISQLVKRVEVWRQGKIINLDVEECGFGYRASLFKTALKDDIILNVELALVEGDKKESGRQLADFLLHRGKSQPVQPSAGCIFKNFLVTDSAQILDRLTQITDVPEEFRKYKKIPAGWLVEQAGMKGARVGQARVSAEHANFIVNLGGAKASEVKELIRQIKNKVYDKYHLQLEEEMQII